MRVLFSISFLFFIFSNNSSATETFNLEDQADRINYSIGHQIGNDFKRQKVIYDEQSIRLGIKDGEQLKTPLIDKKEMNTVLTELKKNITNKMKKDAEVKIQSRRKIEQEKRAAGTAFMIQNQKNPGIKTLPSGLQYKIITEGSGGMRPKAESYVTFHYRAKTLDGKEYDSSYKKGNPATFRANGVLPGFTEAIQLMQPGAKWELYIPPEQAYGRQGPLAHQTIILETELLSIKE